MAELRVQPLQNQQQSLRVAPPMPQPELRVAPPQQPQQPLQVQRAPMGQQSQISVAPPQPQQRLDVMDAQGNRPQLSANLLDETKKRELATVIARMEELQLPPEQIKQVVEGYIRDNQKAPEPDPASLPPDRSKGFFGRLLDDFKQRKQNLQESSQLVDEGKQGNLGFGFQVAGQLAGGVGDVIGEGLTSAFRTVAPDAVQQGVAKAGDVIGQSGVVQDLVGKYQGFKENNPATAKNIESAFNIASLIPVGRASTAVKSITGGALERLAPNLTKRIGQNAAVSTGREFLEGIGKQTVGRLEESVGASAFDDALKVTRPIIDEKAASEAIIGGNVKSGLLGGLKVIPSQEDNAIARAVEGIVSSKNSVPQNVQAIDGAIGTIAEGVTQELKTHNGIFNTNQLRSQLSAAKEKSKVIFGTDKTLENNYDAVVDEMIRLVDERPKNMTGLWDARKEFDKIIREKFGDKYLNSPVGDNVRRNAVRDVRRTVNDYISERLPEGNSYKDALARMTKMYDARERIGLNSTGLVNNNIIKQGINAVKNHPVISAIAFTGISTGSLGAILGSPVAIAALLTGGSVIVAGKVLTSAAFRAGLLKMLKNGDKIMSVAEKQAVMQLIQSIDTGGANE